MNEKEKRDFWKDVYIASIRAGKSSREAILIADYALESFVEKFRD